MSLIVETHLKELKYRLLFITLSFFLSFSILYIYSIDLISLLTNSLNKDIIFTELSEAFICQLELSFLGSIYLTVPFILFQLGSFFKPGLYYSEVLRLNKILILCLLLYVFALIFSLGYLLPILYSFLKSYESIDNVSTTQIIYVPRLRELLSFIYIFTFTLTLVFELPILILLLYLCNVIKISTVTKLRKYNIIFSFIIGAITSPPDIFSQICIAIPLIILYEVSIIVILRVEKSMQINDLHTSL